MDKKNVLVLFGGCSMEHDISKASAANIMRHMGKYNIIPVYITREGKWLLYDGKLDNFSAIPWEQFGTAAVLNPDRTNRGLLRRVGDRVKNIPVDVVFPVLHGENGEDGTVQGLCELAGIPYVGCGVLASAIGMDKSFCKIIAHAAGIKQADYLTFKTEDLKDDIDAVAKTIRYKLGYPCFVKPAIGGSSIGISRATKKKELLEALYTAAEYASVIVVEEAIKGREVECAVIGGGGMEVMASMPGEIVPDGEFYDYDAKYVNEGSRTIVPADLPADLTDEVRETAIKVFNAIGGKGLARVDFFIEHKTKRVIFNEINTMPGFTDISMFPMLWEAAGLDRAALIDRLIENALV